MSVLERIEKAEIRDLLGKGWLTHDGMWFFQVGSRCGMETANALNKGAIKAMAPIEVARARKLLGFEADITAFDELADFLLSALELTLPRSVSENMQFTTPGKNILHWRWEPGSCFAYKGMSQMGVIGQYRCGVMYRIECWLEALGIRYAVAPKIEGCLMHENGLCEGDIQVLQH